MADSDVAYLQLASQNFGTALNVAASAAETKKARNWQEAMYQRQRSDALADYDMRLADIKNMQAEQREYDSYASQVERLKDAGLNPSLAYGGENNGVQISSQNDVRSSIFPSPVTPSPVGAALGDITQAGYRAAQIALQDKQIALEKQRVDFQRDLSAAQALKALSERNLIDAQTYNKGLENIFAESTLGKRIEQVNVSVDEATQRIQESKQIILESISRINVNEKQVQKISADIDLINQNFKNLKLMAEQIKAETFKTWESGKTEVFKRENLSADTSLKEMSILLNQSRKMLTDVETQLKSLEIPKAEVDAFLAPLKSASEIVGNIFTFITKK